MTRVGLVEPHPRSSRSGAHLLQAATSPARHAPRRAEPVRVGRSARGQAHVRDSSLSLLPSVRAAALARCAVVSQPRPLADSSAASQRRLLVVGRRRRAACSCQARQARRSPRSRVPSACPSASDVSQAIQVFSSVRSMPAALGYRRCARGASPRGRSLHGWPDRPSTSSGGAPRRVCVCFPRSGSPTPGWCCRSQCPDAGARLITCAPSRVLRSRLASISAALGQATVPRPRGDPCSASRPPRTRRPAHRRRGPRSDPSGTPGGEPSPAPGEAKATSGCPRTRVSPTRQLLAGASVGQRRELA